MKFKIKYFIIAIIVLVLLLIISISINVHQRAIINNAYISQPEGLESAKYRIKLYKNRAALDSVKIDSLTFLVNNRPRIRIAYRNTHKREYEKINNLNDSTDRAKYLDSIFANRGI